MQSFKNFIHNLCARRSAQNLQSFYKQIKVCDIRWISLAINKKTIAKSLLTKELEVYLPLKSYSLKLADTPNGLFFQIGENQKQKAQSTAKHAEGHSQNFNAFIHELLEDQILKFQKILNSKVSPTLSPNELAQEEKALEWLKVTSVVLEKAVLESLTNPDLLFQMLLFMGVNPKNQLSEIRLIIFNLDMKLIFLENGFIRIIIFDDKNKEFGQSQNAALTGDYIFRKREIFDEFTKILSTLSQGIKFV